MSGDVELPPAGCGADVEKVSALRYINKLRHARKVVFEELTITDRADDTVIETQPLSYSIALDFGDLMAFSGLLAIMVDHCNERNSTIKLKLVVTNGKTLVTEKVNKFVSIVANKP